MKDLPDDETVFRTMVQATSSTRRCPQAIKDLENLRQLRNRIFLDRTVGIGVIDREDAIAWSLSGPIARASGVERDLRKDEPYLCYADNWDGQGAEASSSRCPCTPTATSTPASRSASRR